MTTSFLFDAIAHGSLIDVQRTLQAGADANQRNRANSTLLHHAVTYDAQRIAQVLIEAGTDLGLTNQDGRTPLHQAILYKRDALAVALLTHEAHVNACDGHGWTPLHHAVATRSWAMVNVLLQHGADPLIRATTPSVHALDLTREGGDPVLVERIERHVLHQEADRVHPSPRADGGCSVQDRLGAAYRPRL